MTTESVVKTFKLGGDLEINRLGFGAMRIVGQGVWGEPQDPENSKAVLKRAVELGVDFIDTADSYGPDVSERLIGEALSPYKAGLVIATKGGLTRQGPGKWQPVGRAEYLTQQVEMSLRLLRTDCLDLWQLHRIDPKTPVEESLEAMVKMQDAGKIRHIGLSEVKVPEIEQARKVCKIVSVQNKYNIGDRTHEDVVEYCTREGDRLYPVVSSSGRRSRQGRRQARLSREAAGSDCEPALSSVAATSLASHPADSRHLIHTASRRKSEGGRA